MLVIYEPILIKTGWQVSSELIGANVSTKVNAGKQFHNLDPRAVVKLRLCIVGMAETVHVHRVRRVPALLFVVPLLLRSRDQEQDFRGNRESVCVKENEQS